ncbi:MAG TPA: hypothetical protein VLJ38_21270 [Polyangiaceae bacterium]|nr:hypothetical protein [Polyangiaceae bacterium]
MTEPKRWIDDGPPEAIQHLLRAASAERPTEQSLSRTLTVLGVGVGASGAAATAGAATAAGSATAAGGTMTAGGAAASGALGAAGVKATTIVVASGVVKWGAVVTALAVAAVAGRGALKHAASATSNQPATTAVPPSAVVAPRRVEARLGIAATAVSAGAEARVSAAATASGSAEGPLQSGPKSTATEPNVARKSSRGVSAMQKSPSAVADAPAIAVAPTVVDASPVDTEHLAEEVALVDRARGALASGDAAGALAALDEYDAHFTRRKFGPEALYLRMESLLREGRAEAARGVARSLTNSYPKSPHAARARQVLGQTIP